MEKLRILQAQFVEGAKRFPGLKHVLIEWLENYDAFNPLENPKQKFEFKKTDFCKTWYDEPNQRYKPSKAMMHGLIKPEYPLGAAQAYYKLAEKAGQTLSDIVLPPHLELSTYVRNLKDLIERWTLAVHEVGEGNIKLMRIGGSETRNSLKVINDIFFESASVCGRFWEQEKVEKLQPPLSDKGAAVFELLSGLPKHRALTGPQILDELEKKRIFIDPSTLTKRITKELKPYGIQNIPRIGYFIRK